MRRTKPQGGSSGGSGTMTGNMSYTNLALMASEFENALTTQPKFAIATVGASSEESEELLYLRAMEHIQKGLKLDMNSPMQASEHYQSGSELLSRALLLGTASPQRLDEMQRALDMVEERMRFISGALSGRAPGGSESSFTTAMPSSTSLDADDPAPISLTALAAEKRPSNVFDLSRPDALPPLVQQAAAMCAAHFEQLARQFGFQHQSVYCQQEHLAMLVANCASRERDPAAGLSVLHAQLLSNYKAWARQVGITPQCAGESDVLTNKATDLVLYLLIWGEAANLKHVPESLCFLFHKMRTELW